MVSRTKLQEGDYIYVQQFDELNGIEPEILKLVNSRIDSVKVQAEYRISTLRKECEALRLKHREILDGKVTLEFIVGRLPNLCNEP